MAQDEELRFWAMSAMTLDVPRGRVRLTAPLAGHLIARTRGRELHEDAVCELLLGAGGENRGDHVWVREGHESGTSQCSLCSYLAYKEGF